MMKVGNRYRTKEPDLIEKIIELETRISKLERSPQIGDTAIDARSLTIREGSLIVKDNNDVITVIAGKFDNGDYGLAAINDIGQLVQLNTLAFGQKAAFNTNNGTLIGPSSTYRDLGPVGDINYGPEVTGVLIGDSGRCKVTVSAQMQSTFVAQDGCKCAMSFAVSGATTQAAANDRALVIHNSLTPSTATIFWIVRASYVHYIDNLNPGLHTFTAKYVGGDIDGISVAEFSDRLILVEPF
jgi:hypothetical protein